MKGYANAYVINAGADGNDVGGIDEDLFGIFASKALQASLNLPLLVTSTTTQVKFGASCLVLS